MLFRKAPQLKFPAAKAAAVKVMVKKLGLLPEFLLGLNKTTKLLP